MRACKHHTHQQNTRSSLCVFDGGNEKNVLVVSCTKKWRRNYFFFVFLSDAYMSICHQASHISTFVAAISLIELMITLSSGDRIKSVPHRRFIDRNIDFIIENHNGWTTCEERWFPFTARVAHWVYDIQIEKLTKTDISFNSICCNVYLFAIYGKVFVCDQTQNIQSRMSEHTTELCMYASLCGPSYSCCYW